VGSIEGRLAKLEERRLKAAIALIFARARAATVADVAKFTVTGFMLEQAGEGTESLSEQAVWECLGIPLETVRLAEGRTELWCNQLGDVLAERRGLREYMRRHYPETARVLYGPRSADEG
jgi:hypothetical protein